MKMVSLELGDKKIPIIWLQKIDRLIVINKSGLVDLLTFEQSIKNCQNSLIRFRTDKNSMQHFTF